MEITKMSYLDFLIACGADDVENVKKFLNENSDIDLNKNVLYSMPPGFFLPLPLVKAAHSKSKKVIKILIEHGANPDNICKSKNYNGKSARMLFPEWF